MATGKISNFDLLKKSGFIKTDQGQKLFFHQDDIDLDLQKSGFHSGMRVEFDLLDTAKEPKAIKVRQLGKPAEQVRLPVDKFDGFRRRTENRQRRERPEERAADEIWSPEKEYENFLNPYNFVRALRSPENANQLSEIPPLPHDRYLGLTGVIHCRLEAVTPLFIADSHGSEGAKHEHKSYRFFRDGDGEYAIPSTSLKGMIRSVFEAATNSCFGVFTDKSLTKRPRSDDNQLLVPCRVHHRGDRWTLELLPGTSTFFPSVAPGDEKRPLYAGWVRIWVYNAASSETVKQNPDSEYAKRSFPVIRSELKSGTAYCAFMRRMFHPAKANRWGRKSGAFFFWNVEEIAKTREELTRTIKDEANEVIEQGYYYHNNKNIHGKHDERFFFRADDNTSWQKEIELTDDAKKAYEDLLADYQERHKKEIIKKRDSNIPETSTTATVEMSRFILAAKSELADGELVYAKISGDENEPVVEYLVPVAMPRIAHKSTTRQVLENSMPHLVHCQNYENLCPACRVFGWVREEADRRDLVKKAAYAGRVNITMGKLAVKKVENKAVALSILSSPKPTTTLFYLANKDGRPSKDLEYDIEHNAKLRGRKFYRHHGKWREMDEFQRKEHLILGKSSDQNRTLKDHLLPESAFTFDVQFESLTTFELGALLWSILLPGDVDCYHRLGLAKPLGFGSVKISLQSNELGAGVKIMDPLPRYSSWSNPGWRELTMETVSKLIEKFKDAMLSEYGSAKQAFEKLQNIADLQAILSKPPLEHIHYPRQTASRQAKDENFLWFTDNLKEANPQLLKLAAEDKAGLKFLDDKKPAKR